MEKQKIAILITHGAGEQEEFDTLDVFARNLVHSLQQDEERALACTHRHLQSGSASQEYVRLTDADRPGWEVDVHEYFWAPLMERQISLRETLEWLESVAQHADVGGIGLLLRLLRRLGTLGEKLMPPALDPLYKGLMGRASRMVVESLGDVAVYAAQDLRAKWHEVREHVLDGALEKIIALLHEDYDRVILVGHSLGSVVLYDALNRLNLQMNDDAVLAAKRHKLLELVTLGSPLDMTSLALTEPMQEEDYVRRLILDHVQGFRRCFGAGHVPPGTVLTSTVQDCLLHLRWTNYWDVRDPIGGPLTQFYGVENRQIDNGCAWGFAHLGYFENMQIYREMIGRFAPIGQPLEVERHLRAI